jgi:tetratricopeptide (TPR) repeat protein
LQSAANSSSSTSSTVSLYYKKMAGVASDLLSLRIHAAYLINNPGMNRATWELARDSAILVEAGLAMMNRCPIAETYRVLDVGFQMAKRADYAPGLAEALYGLAWIEMEHNNLERASELTRQSLALNEEMGNLRRASKAWHMLGVIHTSWDKYDDARAFLNNALDLLKSIARTEDAGTTFHELARLAYVEGKLDESRAHAITALELEKRAGDLTSQPHTLHLIAQIDLAQGKTDSVRSQLEDVLRLEDQMDDRLHQPGALLQLGEIDFGQGRYRQAHQSFSRAIAIAQELGDRRVEADIWRTLSGLAHGQGNLPTALRLLCMSHVANTSPQPLDHDAIRENATGLFGAANMAVGEIASAIRAAMRARRLDGGIRLAEAIYPPDNQD